MSVRKRTWTNGKGEPQTAWVVDYRDQGGTRRLKTFPRKKDADAWAAQTTVAVRDGLHVADRDSITIAEAGRQWLATCDANGLERTTVAQYDQHLRLHIVPFIGATRLSRLSAPMVREFQDRLREADRSPQMVKRVTVSLGSIIADAEERGQVAGNVVHSLARRRSKTRAAQREKRAKKRLEVGVDIPTPDEARAFLSALSGRYRPLFMTAVFSGLRASELRGLRWADVDLASHQIAVRQRADAHNQIGMPKTAAGQRMVPIPPAVVKVLQEWKPDCPKGDLDLVFPNSTGRVEWHANIINRGLEPSMIAAGLVKPDGTAKYGGMHALRHFYASWCINRRADGGLELPPKTVQTRMGHSSITVTMDTYGHLFPAQDETKAMAEAEKLLLGNGMQAT